MNKQEFISSIKAWGSWLVEDGEKDRYVKISKVRELVEQLDEPQKVVVPKEFDEWYQLIKQVYTKHFYAEKFALWKLGQRGFGHSFEDVKHEAIDYDSKLYKWLDKNTQLAVNAVLNGYEVEKEPAWVEKEPAWVVKYYSRELERECYFSMAYGTKEFDIDFANRTTLKVNAFKFESKEKAEALALLIDGTVEEV